MPPGRPVNPCPPGRPGARRLTRRTARRRARPQRQGCGPCTLRPCSRQPKARLPYVGLGAALGPGWR
eukprot:8236402-Alexandrium_andersonii.AAC.1